MGHWVSKQEERSMAKGVSENFRFSATAQSIHKPESHPKTFLKSEKLHKRMLRSPKNFLAWLCGELSSPREEYRSSDDCHQHALLDCLLKCFRMLRHGDDGSARLG